MLVIISMKMLKVNQPRFLDVRWTLLSFVDNTGMALKNIGVFKNVERINCSQ